MKTKLLLIIASFVAIQSLINIASEQPSLISPLQNYARTKWAEFLTSPTQYLKTVAVAPIAYMVQHFGPGLIIGTTQALGIKRWSKLSPWESSFGNLPTTFIWLIAAITTYQLYKQIGQKNDTTFETTSTEKTVSESSVD